MSIQDFINKLGIKIQSEYASSNPNMADDKWKANHYKVVMHRGKKQMTIYYSKSLALSGEPEADEVLDSMASDAAGFENARDFEDWCGEYGYDTDSRKAERIFKTVERQAQALQKFLGEADYKALLWDTERL